MSANQIHFSCGFFCFYFLACAKALYDFGFANNSLCVLRDKRKRIGDERTHKRKKGRQKLGERRKRNREKELTFNLMSDSFSMSYFLEIVTYSFSAHKFNEAGNKFRIWKLKSNYIRFYSLHLYSIDYFFCLVCSYACICLCEWHFRNNLENEQVVFKLLNWIYGRKRGRFQDITFKLNKTKQ